MPNDTRNELAPDLRAVADAERKIAMLATENAALRKAAADLRRRVAPSRAQRLTARAYEDARIIMHYRHAGMSPSRRWLDDCGIMTARRYGWAIALLRVARMEDVTPASIHHLSQCIDRLRSTADAIIETGDLNRLRMRGNANIRRRC